jgi:hypothetical protein
MPETTSRPRPDAARAAVADDPLVDRVLAARAGLAVLLREAEDARRRRAETAAGDGGVAVCAWNHFENIPTFYNWNNRPR